MKTLVRFAGLGALILLATAACAQSAPASSTPMSEAPTVADATQASPTEAPVETPTETTAPSPEPLPAASLPDPAGYEWTLVSDVFLQPLLLTNAGDGSGRLFVVEQDGLIRILENGSVLESPFLDLTARVTIESNEQGLLGLAFHPNYAQNGTFFVNYTDWAGDTVVSRFQVSADANIADAGSELIILQVDQPFANHNGGNIVFGPEGYLYIGMGDGGSQGDPNGNGQSPDVLLGKLLRLDVDSGAPYVIPVDNPFGRGGGLGEIWALGLRNPWRFTFDSATGDLYIGDVGGSQLEEIDFLPSGSAGGTNFGWNYFEGTLPLAGSPPAGAVLVPPVAEYEHGSSRCAVTGGYVYRGAALPAWQGVYVYGDYCSGEIWGLVYADGAWENSLLYETGFLITSFGVDEAGELYVVARDGNIYLLQAN